VLSGWALNFLVRQVPVKWEVELADEVYDEIKEHFKPVDDPKLTAELRALTDRLGRALPNNKYKFKPQIIDTPIPNAVALPGGRILVTTGLFRVDQDSSARQGDRVRDGCVDDLRFEFVFVVRQCPAQTVGQRAQFRRQLRIIHRLEVLLDFVVNFVGQLDLPLNRHLPHQKVECPAAQHPDRCRDNGERDQKDPCQPDGASALPLPAELASQQPQPVASGEEITFQYLFVRSVNHPV